ncbi:hypothetical protein B0H65DRAFT_465947 [Neurospora tetraspora]|uniref:Uncharacterized protein n=1 Tax=Neurospora tetraspora TaxID=94610 RepID=A0AAE0MT39_9PEZI|nr:hypothetical protein B0H65DRAFT_465947 [Neurospora tetraspora]
MSNLIMTCAIFICWTCLIMSPAYRDICLGDGPHLLNIVEQWEEPNRHLYPGICLQPGVNWSNLGEDFRNGALSLPVGIKVEEHVVVIFFYMQPVWTGQNWGQRGRQKALETRWEPRRRGAISLRRLRLRLHLHCRSSGSMMWMS